MMSQSPKVEDAQGRTPGRATSGRYGGGDMQEHLARMGKQLAEMEAQHHQMFGGRSQPDRENLAKATAKYWQGINLATRHASLIDVATSQDTVPALQRSPSSPVAAQALWDARNSPSRRSSDSRQSLQARAVSRVGRSVTADEVVTLASHTGARNTTTNTVPSPNHSGPTSTTSHASSAVGTPNNTIHNPTPRDDAPSASSTPRSQPPQPSHAHPLSHDQQATDGTSSPSSSGSSFRLPSDLPARRAALQAYWERMAGRGHPEPAPRSHPASPEAPTRSQAYTHQPQVPATGPVDTSGDVHVFTYPRVVRGRVQPGSDSESITPVAVSPESAQGRPSDHRAQAQVSGGALSSMMASSSTGSVPTSHMTLVPEPSFSTQHVTAAGTSTNSSRSGSPHLAAYPPIAQTLTFPISPEVDSRRSTGTLCGVGGRAGGGHAARAAAADVDVAARMAAERLMSSPPARLPAAGSMEPDLVLMGSPLPHSLQQQQYQHHSVTEMSNQPGLVAQQPGGAASGLRPFTAEPRVLLYEPGRYAGSPDMTDIPHHHGQSGWPMTSQAPTRWVAGRDPVPTTSVPTPTDAWHGPATSALPFSPPSSNHHATASLMSPPPHPTPYAAALDSSLPPTPYTVTSTFQLPAPSPPTSHPAPPIPGTSTSPLPWTQTAAMLLSHANAAAAHASSSSPQLPGASPDPAFLADLTATQRELRAAIRAAQEERRALDESLTQLTNAAALLHAKGSALGLPLPLSDGGGTPAPPIPISKQQQQQQQQQSPSPLPEHPDSQSTEASPSPSSNTGQTLEVIVTSPGGSRQVVVSHPLPDLASPSSLEKLVALKTRRQHQREDTLHQRGGSPSHSTGTPPPAAATLFTTSAQLQADSSPVPATQHPHADSPSDTVWTPPARGPRNVSSGGSVRGRQGTADAATPISATSGARTGEDTPGSGDRSGAVSTGTPRSRSRARSAAYAGPGGGGGGGVNRRMSSEGHRTSGGSGGVGGGFSPLTLDLPGAGTPTNSIMAAMQRRRRSMSDVKHVVGPPGLLTHEPAARPSTSQPQTTVQLPPMITNMTAAQQQQQYVGQGITTAPTLLSLASRPLPPPIPPSTEPHTASDAFMPGDASPSPATASQAWTVHQAQLRAATPAPPAPPPTVILRLPGAGLELGHGSTGLSSTFSPGVLAAMHSTLVQPPPPPTAATTTLALAQPPTPPHISTPMDMSLIAMGLSSSGAGVAISGVTGPDGLLTGPSAWLPTNIGAALPVSPAPPPPPLPPSSYPVPGISRASLGGDPPHIIGGLSAPYTRPLPATPPSTSSRRTTTDEKPIISTAAWPLHFPDTSHDTTTTTTTRANKSQHSSSPAPYHTSPSRRTSNSSRHPASSPPGPSVPPDHRKSSGQLAPTSTSTAPINSSHQQPLSVIGTSGPPASSALQRLKLKCLARHAPVLSASVSDVHPTLEAEVQGSGDGVRSMHHPVGDTSHTSSTAATVASPSVHSLRSKLGAAARLRGSAVALVQSTGAVARGGAPGGDPGANWRARVGETSASDGGEGSGGGADSPEAAPKPYLKRRSQKIVAGKVDWSHVKSRTVTRMSDYDGPTVYKPTPKKTPAKSPLKAGAPGAKRNAIPTKHINNNNNNTSPAPRAIPRSGGGATTSNHPNHPNHHHMAFTDHRDLIDDWTPVKPGVGYTRPQAPVISKAHATASAAPTPGYGKTGAAAWQDGLRGTGGPYASPVHGRRGVGGGSGGGGGGSTTPGSPLDDLLNHVNHLLKDFDQKFNVHPH